MNPGSLNQVSFKRNLLPPLVSPPKLPKFRDEPFIAAFDHDMARLMEDRKPEVVYLNIYNVHSVNKVLEFLGFGFYHTSIQLYNHEFSYGGHDYDVSGIVVVEAGNCAGLTLKERLPVGVTYYCEDEIDDIIKQYG